MEYACIAMGSELTNLVGLSVRLRMPCKWLAAEADAGRIPYLQTGRQRWFNPEAVRRVLAERAAHAGQHVELRNV